MINIKEALRLRLLDMVRAAMSLDGLSSEQDAALRAVMSAFHDSFYDSVRDVVTKELQPERTVKSRKVTSRK
jgi:hypothetical protein